MDTEDGIVFLQMENLLAVPGHGRRSAVEMNAIACDDRRKLRDAVIAYKNGTISTYAFDDLNCECMDSHDEFVRQISEQLYLIHDDTVDHPISVTQATWNALKRIVAFLETDSAGSQDTTNDFWPFKDESEWNTHRSKLDEINIPLYDPAIHALPVHGLLSRIPTLVGFGIIAVVIGVLVVVLISTR